PHVDGAATGETHHQGGAAARIVAASYGPVVVEGAVGDSGGPELQVQGPAGGDADPALGAIRTRVAGAADGLVVRKRRPANDQRSPVEIDDAAADAQANVKGTPGLGRVAAAAADTLIAGKGTVLDR